MPTNEKLLSQNDVDAILNQSGLEGSHDQNDKENPHPEEGKKSVPKQKRSREEAKAISYHLYNKAFLEREEGVSVIWNAATVMPMEAGLNVKILGKDYLSLGVLNQRHLILGSSG